VDVLQPDIAHCGGISEVWRIAKMAEAYNVALVPHCPLGPIALTASVQVDAVSANFAIQEMSLGIHYNVGADWKTYAKNPEVWDILPEDMIRLPEGPGSGIEVDEEQVRAAASKTVEAWRSPIFFAANGEIREW
jgi:galactonate dehydratase